MKSRKNAHHAQKYLPHSALRQRGRKIPAEAGMVRKGISGDRDARRQLRRAAPPPRRRGRPGAAVGRQHQPQGLPSQGEPKCFEISHSMLFSSCAFAACSRLISTRKSSHITYPPSEHKRPPLGRAKRQPLDIHHRPVPALRQRTVSTQLQRRKRHNRTTKTDTADISPAVERIRADAGKREVAFSMGHAARCMQKQPASPELFRERPATVLDGLLTAKQKLSPRLTYGQGILVISHPFLLRFQPVCRLRYGGVAGGKRRVSRYDMEDMLFPLPPAQAHGSTSPQTGQTRRGPSGVSTSRRAWPQTGQQAGVRRGAGPRSGRRAVISAAPAAAAAPAVHSRSSAGNARCSGRRVPPHPRRTGGQ